MLQLIHHHLICILETYRVRNIYFTHCVRLTKTGATTSLLLPDLHPGDLPSVQCYPTQLILITESYWKSLPQLAYLQPTIAWPTSWRPTERVISTRPTEFTKIDATTHLPIPNLHLGDLPRVKYLPHPVDALLKKRENLTDIGIKTYPSVDALLNDNLPYPSNQHNGTYQNIYPHSSWCKKW